MEDSSNIRTYVGKSSWPYRILILLSAETLGLNVAYLLNSKAIRVTVSCAVVLILKYT